MATSRTGTGKWQRIRKEMLKQAQVAGITRCPMCGNSFDWTRPYVARSPEVDHIVPHSMGGADSMENVRLICRDCNVKRGGQLGKARRALRLRNLKSVELDTATDW